MRMKQGRVSTMKLRGLVQLLVGTVVVAAVVGVLPAHAAGADAVAPDIRPEMFKDLRQSYGFKTMDNPKMVSAAEATFMKDENYVLGVTVEGESRAYPTRFMGWHHGVNDRVKDTPYAVTFCSVCNTGIAYDLRMEGKQRFLDFYGLYNGVVVLCDRETESAFIQAEGRFVKGPLTGSRLKHIALLNTTWAQWKKLHPDTKVMSPDSPFNSHYRPADAPETRERKNLSPFFIGTLTRGDLRLKPFDMVVGLTQPVGGETAAAKIRYRAYPVQAVLDAGGVVNDVADGEPVAVFAEPTSRAGAAVSRMLDGKTLTFEGRKDADGQVAYYDKETGSRWNLEGKAESGPLAGKTLKTLIHNQSYWYGWSAYFPETSVFGTTDGPKPGNFFEAAPSPATK